LNYPRYLHYHNAQRYQQKIQENGNHGYKSMLWIALGDLSNANEFSFVQEIVSFYYPIAQSRKRDMLIGMIDFSRFPEHVQMLGIPFVPGLMIVDGPNKFLYPLQLPILSPEHVFEFLDRFDRGLLPVHRSVREESHLGNEEVQPVRASTYVNLPGKNNATTVEYRYGVYLLDGNTVDKALIAWNERSHILMCYYLSHDRSSRKFLFDLQKIAKAFSDANEINHTPQLVVMQIDCANSDCPEMIETFPHVRFYEKNSIDPFIGGIGLQSEDVDGEDIRFYKGGAGMHYTGGLNATAVVDSLKKELLERITEEKR